MDFLYLLEKLRNPVMDTFFSCITYLGSEEMFLAVAIVVFWCFSKCEGYYLMTTGFFGTIINQSLKLIFRIPRPWVRDPNFTIVESAREAATGYSFPSGHSQNAVTVFGCPARYTKNKRLRVVCIILILLTGFSRMWLGVHSPLDVLVSFAITTALVFIIYPIFKKIEQNPKYMYHILSLLAACSLIYVLAVSLYSWPADVDPENLASGIKNGYVLLGCTLGMLISFYLERRFLNFKVEAPVHAQVLKVVLGLILVLAVKIVLKPVLNALFAGHYIASAVRYFIIVLVAAFVWPMTFPWFQKGCPLSRRAKKVLISIGIVLLVLIVAAGLLFWQVTKDTSDEPVSTENAENSLITQLGTTMLSGHRAGGGIAPENTMMALKNCIDNPDYELDIFEFDIHLTSDGIPVLLHDSTLDRTSDAAEHFGENEVDVGAKTLEELKELNMGEHFVSVSGDAPYAGLRGDDIPEDLRIVTLEEALSYLEASGDFHYIIEIKNSGDVGLEAADKLYATLEKFGCTQRTIVGTFHNEVTAYLDETYPDLPRSAGVSEVIEFYLYSLLNLNAEDGKFRFVALQIPTTDYTINLGTSRLVNYAHRNNIAVQYWTINDASEMARLQSIGADAIMTDVPDVGAQVLVRP